MLNVNKIRYLRELYLGQKDCVLNTCVTNTEKNVFKVYLQKVSTTV